MTSTTDSVPVYQTGGCGCGPGSGCALHGERSLEGLERTRYFPRQLVGPDDLTQDQNYVNDKLRRHNRFVHGWGIVCGLVVERCAATDPTTDVDPCRVKVSAGYALDPYGDEVLVPSDQVVDLCKEDLGGGLSCGPSDGAGSDFWCAPADAVRGSQRYYLAIRHVEQAIKPVHAPTGCSCGAGGCENSRIRDWYEFTLLPEKPAHYLSRDCTLEEDFCDAVATCPPCPDSGWIILASVVMNGPSIEELDADDCRQHVLSFAHFCVDCNDVGLGRPGPVLGQLETAHYVGSASPASDAVVAVPVVLDGAYAEATVAVTEADLKGRKAADVQAAWNRVAMFDTERPTVPAFAAGMLLANSNLSGDSVVDGAEDLALRLGTPVIDRNDYKDKLDRLEAVLEGSGYRQFTTDKLANLRRVGELDIATLASVAKANADRLRAAGIETLADVRDAEELPTLPKAAAASVRAAQEFLRELDIGGE